MRPGDKVKCIDADYAKGLLERGKTYEVTGYDYTGKICLKETDLPYPHYWRTTRFELVKASPSPSSKFYEEAARIADLVSQKQAKYGDSFGKSGEVMKILYPNGIPLDQFDKALTVVRILDKLFRVATNNDPGGENPFQDIAGYALLELVKGK